MERMGRKEMNYIRTRDGKIRIVIEPSEFDEEERNKIPDNCTMVKAFNMFGCEIISNKQIVVKSNKIKSLCDLFIKKSREKGNDFIEVGKDSFHVFDMKYNSYDLEHYDYYGAIFTPKGIIYIAKLNKKGELELL